ncbi:MAG: hypothetical protein DRP78_01690 [Candidatus Omnitrophota bacterium]|nr:MAG: hypothetical protein DRP78_01690 [Candidatus Omnitrophota bacterium]
MFDQAQKLREMVKSSSLENFFSDTCLSCSQTPDKLKKSFVIALLSGKGGVGKTVITANLALALGALGKKVLIIDSSWERESISIILKSKFAKKLHNLQSGNAAVNECIVQYSPNIKIISGRPANSTCTQELNKKMETIIKQNDFILIDNNAGISQQIISTALNADQTIIVTTPEPTSVASAYALIKNIIAKNNSAKLQLLLNMAIDKEDAIAAAQKITYMVKHFLHIEIKDFGYILSDTVVPISVRKRVPFLLASPHSHAARMLNTLAEKLSPAQQQKKIHKNRRKNNYSGIFEKILVDSKS